MLFIWPKLHKKTLFYVRLLHYDSIKTTCIFVLFTPPHVRNQSRLFAMGLNYIKTNTRSQGHYSKSLYLMLIYTYLPIDLSIFIERC